MFINTMAQSGWSGTLLTNKNWREIVLNRLEELDWERVEMDVRPFRINQKKLTGFTQ